MARDKSAADAMPLPVRETIAGRCARCRAIDARLKDAARKQRKMRQPRSVIHSLFSA